MKWTKEKKGKELKCSTSIKKINAIFNIIFNTISKHITNIFIRFYNPIIKHTNKKKIKTTAFLGVCEREGVVWGNEKYYLWQNKSIK